MADLSLAMIPVKPILNVGLIPRGYGVVKEPEATEEDEDPVNANVRFPPSARFVKPYADDARIVAARYAEVSRIFLIGHIAKVINSVVKPIAVDVINLAFRKYAVDPKPDNPVCGYLSSSKFTLPIPMPISRGKRSPSSVSGVKHACLLLLRPLTCLKKAWEGVVPCQFTRHRAIIEKMSNSLGVHIGSPWLILDHNTYKGGTQYVR